MRFGISATSWIFPKNLRTRLRPVNVCAISSLALSNRRGRDDSPEGRHPSRPSGQPSKPLFYVIRPPPNRHAVTATGRRYGRLRDLLTRNRPQRIHTYLSSTFAPAFSSWALTFSASSLFTPSLTGLGAPSTRSLASLRPSPVSARTSLITSIFLSPIAVSTTVNSVFSSTGAAAAPPGAAATATAAAAETPHFSSSNFARSAASRTVSFERSSTSFCRSAIEHPYGFEPVEFCRADHAASLSLLEA